MKKTVLLSLIVFVFAFAIRVHWIGVKGAIDTQESNTFLTANAHAPNLPPKMLTGKEVKQIVHANPKTIKENFIILSKLHKNNCGDYAHTNLYFSLYRIWMSGHKENYFSKQALLRRGCSLNLVFFTISFWAMFYMLLLIFDSSRKSAGEPESPALVVPLGLAAAYLNNGGISNTVYIREYQFQEMMFVIMALVFVVFYQKIKVTSPSAQPDDTGIISIKNFVILSLTLCFTFMSGYFIIIYVVLLGIVLLVSLAKGILTNSAICEKWRTLGVNLAFIASSFICATGLILILYPPFFKGFHHEKAMQANTHFTLQSLIAFKNSLPFFNNFVHELVFNIPLTPLLAILALCLLFNLTTKKQRQEGREALILMVVGFIWTITIAHLTPDKNSRYLYPSIPVISLIVPYIVYKARALKFFLAVFFFIITIAGGTWLLGSREIFARKQFFKKLDFRTHIEHLSGFGCAPRLINQHQELPVALLSFNICGAVSSAILQLNEEQKYIKIDRPNPQKYKPLNHFYTLDLSYNPRRPPEGFRVLQYRRCSNITEYELELIPENTP